MRSLTTRTIVTAVTALLAVFSVAGEARACQVCLATGNSIHGVGLPLPSASAGPFVNHPAASGQALSLNVPQLSSRPGAPVRVYLDFNGDLGPAWFNFTVGETPAFSIDNDPLSFNPAELSAINEVYQRVAEAYSPFDVNVTTVEPWFLDRDFFRIVVGGTGSWYPQTVGGLAIVGSYQSVFLPKTAWVFSRNLLPDDPQHASFVAAATAHEAGHAFGLEHQSSFAPDGMLIDRYNRGDEFKAPFMGSSYRKRGLWWNGPNEYGATQIQDDLSLLTGGLNGFGYRADDHANTTASATPMSFVDTNTVGGSGVIERMSDVDVFAFDTLAGEVSFTLFPAPFGAMLDGSLALYDTAGGLIRLVNTPSLGETLAMTLPAGSYHMAVLSRGNYGDIGQYTLRGSIIPVPEPAGLVGAAIGVVVLLRRSRSGA